MEIKHTKTKGLITIGMVFFSKWFEGEVKVIGCDVDTNTLRVRIKDSWEEEWNLEHTIWGFEKGEYFRKD